MKTNSNPETTVKRLLSCFWTNESGATSIEYGLIVGLAATVIIAAMIPLGDTIRDDVFGTITSALNGAATN